MQAEDDPWPILHNSTQRKPNVLNGLSIKSGTSGMLGSVLHLTELIGFDAVNRELVTACPHIHTHSIPHLLGSTYCSKPRASASRWNAAWTHTQLAN